MTYDPRNTTQFAALQAELALATYAADVTAGNDQKLADRLNGPITGGAVVRRGIRSSREVMSAIVGTEFVALVVGGQNYLIALVSPGEVDLSNDVVRAALAAAFPVGSASRANLTALADKPNPSRAEQLFGVDTVMTAANVSQALGRG